MIYPRNKVLALALFGLFLSTQLLAQEEDYVLGAGDVIQIEVVGEKDMSGSFKISKEGTITYWVLGDVPTAGKSISRFKQELTQILGEKYLQNPVVKLEVKEYHSKEVVVQGAVRNPGNYVLEENWISLVKLISKAGGVTNNVGTFAYIIRGYLNQKPPIKIEVSTQTEPSSDAPFRIEVNLKRLIQDGAVEEDKPIYGGDFVFIASTESETLGTNFVWVEGAVKSPGKIPHQSGLTALSACIQAGGFSDYAAPNKATIHRVDANGKVLTIKVKLKKIRKGKIPDLPLRPGDRLTIPESVF